MLAADHRRAVIAALEPAGISEVGAGVIGTRVAASPEERLRALRDDPRLTRWTRRVAADHLDHPHRANGGTTMDPTIERVLALRRVDIFSTLPYDSLVELAGLVRTRDEPAGAVIIEAGAVGHELYAITSGAVEVRGANGQVTRLDEGTVFGELAVLDPAPRSATVVAATPVELLVVPRATVLALADRRPAVMAEIARVLARRLRVSG
jgi:CRP/FNR family transcriptional regulator, cyclic AMP receptor protein